MKPDEIYQGECTDTAVLARFGMTMADAEREAREIEDETTDDGLSSKILLNRELHSGWHDSQVLPRFLDIPKYPLFTRVCRLLDCGAPTATANRCRR